MDAEAAPGYGLRFLYLFAGPRTDPGSLHAELVALGATLDRFDTAIDKTWIYAMTQFGFQSERPL